MGYLPLLEGLDQIWRATIYFEQPSEAFPIGMHPENRIVLAHQFAEHLVMQHLERTLSNSSLTGRDVERLVSQELDNVKYDGASDANYTHAGMYVFEALA